MSSHNSLEAAAADRKARLARLSNLKRKQTDRPREDAGDTAAAASHDEKKENDKAAERAKYLSGRNYDFETETVKLGFEHDP
ncbi:hypothetical protein KEM54_000328, partial [Ascosphaera aggregata]